MTLRKIFLGYMVLTGIAAGALLVAVPAVADFWLKPYFWILISVLVFDVGIYLWSRNAPSKMLAMDARILGFVVGAVLMFAIPTVAGSPVKFF